MNIHLNGFNQQVATLIAGEPIEPGSPVALSNNENNTVYNVTSENAGDFVGVCMNCRKGRAAVQLIGYMELATDGSSISPGLHSLSFDADGLVTLGGDRQFLVLNNDSVNCIVGILI